MGGHGFHYHNLLSGVYDGAVSEGLSDVVAFLQMGDSKYPHISIPMEDIFEMFLKIESIPKMLLMKYISMV